MRGCLISRSLKLQLDPNRAKKMRDNIFPVHELLSLLLLLLLLLLQLLLTPKPMFMMSAATNIDQRIPNGSGIIETSNRWAENWATRKDTECQNTECFQEANLHTNVNFSCYAAKLQNIDDHAVIKKKYLYCNGRFLGKNTNLIYYPWSIPIDWRRLNDKNVYHAEERVTRGSDKHYL